MNALPYPIVTAKNPILVIQVKGVQLADIDSVGETALYIMRVGDSSEFVKYLPFNERRNQLSFTLDDAVFDRAEGRFVGRLVYKGLEVESIYFVYSAEPVTLAGHTNV